MTEIGNRIGQAHVYLGVAKCWLVQKEFDKVPTVILSIKQQNCCPYGQFLQKCVSNIMNKRKK